MDSDICIHLDEPFLTDMKILIVEDERGLALEIAEFLSKEGYIIEHAWKKASAEEKIFVNTYDIILLDLGLPDGDGLDLLRYLKSLPERDDAVIILTARGAVEDRISGLEEGADDYLPKPFALSELQARMRAITRRKHSVKTNQINLHEFVMDIENRTLSYNNERVNLTNKEFEILYYLTLNKNRVIPRTSLTEHVWGDILEINSDSNFVNVHIKNLRKKLATYSAIEWFETVRSVGYRVNL